jgi:hypothetical protein
MMQRTCLAVLSVACATAAWAERIYKDGDEIRVKPIEVGKEFLNKWPSSWEEDFWARANAIITQKAGTKYGNTYFENEKAAYPDAMFGFIGGFRKEALAKLQEKDNQADSWNKITEGIDYFPCFTIKCQMRKYFFFGEYLDPDYKKQMYRGAKLWTEKDPMRRPNPAWTKKKEGWTPETMNSWVDIRNTDNLQSMRETSVYLMAEETGNEEVRQKYKELIRKYVTNLYHVGMGEWDSANYHGHSFTPFLNLYDFAKDKEVKALAKAALDYCTAVGAFKYWRGSFAGPSRREYSHTTPRSGGAASQMALWFGDDPGKPDSYERDTVFQITSAYRPPKAVVELARKQFKKPQEMFLAHPHYDALRQGAEAPEFHETTYFGETYQLGTLAEGTSNPDVNGFKLLAYDSKEGVSYFVANATTNPLRIGAPQYESPPVQVGRMNIGQFKNSCLVLNAPGDAPWLFQAPQSAKIEEKDDVVFIQFEKTYVALRLIRMKFKGVDKALTEEVSADQKPKVDPKKEEERKKKNLPPEPPKKGPKSGQMILAAKGTGGPVCGFAMEVGENASHGRYSTFKSEILKKTKIDVVDDTATYTAVNGDTLKVKFNEKCPTVWRNGAEHDWATQHLTRYAAAEGEAPITLGWKQGTLTVKAGGETFVTTVTAEGKVNKE